MEQKNSTVKKQTIQISFYNDIKSSPNNFSFWYPKVKGCGLATPDSVIIPVPQDVMQSFFMECPGDRERVRSFVENTVVPAIPAEFGNRIFLKNGCFSDKFRFRFCTPEVNVDSLMNSILEINMDSLAFDTGGNSEIIVRRLVGTADDTFTGTIYEGMRLRPEIRVFYDFDSRKPLYCANYWDWDYCHDAICRSEEDKTVYEKGYPVIKGIFEAQAEYVKDLVHSKMKDADLHGIWSVDMMYAENKWWLIDMAVGQMSAYWDVNKIQEK